jgi:Flp pilus assembly protein TadG
MRRYKTLARLRRDQSGVAAIELALIFPLLMIIFFGMVDVTAVLSDSRKLSYATNAVANIVVRLESPATSGQITDAFKAVDIVMRSAQPTTGTGGTRVEVLNYRKTTPTSTSVDKKWYFDNGVGTGCGDPATAGLSNLMDAGNDIIIVVTCATYQPIMFRILGQRTLGNRTQITLREQIAVRPRLSLLFDCTGCPTPPP